MNPLSSGLFVCCVVHSLQRKTVCPGLFVANAIAVGYRVMVVVVWLLLDHTGCEPISNKK